MTTNRILPNKWQVQAAAVLIFLLGMAAGALALNAYHSWFRNVGRVTRQDRFDGLLDRLQLKEDQRVQVRQIFGDTRTQLMTLRKESEPRVQEIRRQADERLRQVLTPEQWQRFQQLRDESQGSWHRGRGLSDAPPTPR